MILDVPVDILLRHLVGLGNNLRDILKKSSYLKNLLDAHGLSSMPLALRFCRLVGLILI